MTRIAHENNSSPYNIRRYRWRYPETVPEEIQNRLESFSKPFQSILYQRGYESLDDTLNFLLPRQPEWQGDAELLHLDKSCQLISRAIEHKYPIAVFGDYDADGITATALLTLALRKIHSPVIPMIPSRHSDGYGISKQAIADLSSQGVKLIITVDNGIRAISEAAYAREIGVDLIVTDHHSPSHDLPECTAIIDPKLPDDTYPNKNLAGVGVAYKLVAGLADIFPQLHPDDYLDLVAIGTIADLVPLIGENRYLVKKGLQAINQHPRQSLFSLCQVSGLLNPPITSSDISFQIAPRLNSTGRLDLEDHSVPLQLLLSTEQDICGRFAQILDNHNRLRKSLSKKLQERVDDKFADLDQLPPVLFALDDDFDLGVAGISAGYLTQKYYRPAIVGRIGSDTTTASCRSIPEFDITSALESTKDLLMHFGGHKLAAGFTIANKNLEQFQLELLQQAERHLVLSDLQPELQIDALVSFSDLNTSLFGELAKLEPTGEQNPRPIFAAHNLTSSKYSTVGANGEHLKLTLSDGSQTFQGIGFGLGGLTANFPETFKAAFYFTENVYRGKKEFQLQILDLLPV